jgi:hypothetical protein
MKNIILCILSIIILSSVLWISIKKEMGTKVEVTGINTMEEGIKISLDKKPLFAEKKVEVIFQRKNSKLKMICNYYLEKNKPFIIFKQTEDFLDFWGLSWNFETNEMLEMLEKLKSSKIRIRNIYP